MKAGELGARAQAWRARLLGMAGGGRPPGSGGEESAGGKELAGLCARMLEFNRESEGDFLTLGGALLQIRSQTRALEGELGALLEAVGGEKGMAAAKTLCEVSEHANLLGMEVRAGTEQLQRIRGAVAQIQRVFRAFGETVSQFRVLGSLTRIETARLQGTGAEFAHLAEQVSRLSISVEEKVANLLGLSRQIESQVGQALERIRSEGRRQLEGLPAVLEGAERNLGELTKRRVLAERIGADLAAGYGAVGRALDELVGSIQCHDITRQQVEHVVQALEQAGSGAGPLLELQAAQLEAAGATFLDSVRRIEASLERITGEVERMSAASAKLLGSTDEEETPFLLGLERSLTGIARQVARCAESTRAARQEAEALDEPVGWMKSGLEDIARLDLEMLHIALNAQVRATQLGDAGAPLGVLAASMQELVNGAEDRSRTATTSVGEVNEALTRLTALAGREGGEVMQHVQERIAHVHAESESGFARMRLIGAGAAKLLEDLTGVRRSFQAAAIYERTGAACARELRALARRMGGGAVPASEALAALAGNYTMHAEREIHSQAVGSASRVADASAPAPPPAAAPNPPDDELGANVELF